MNSLGNSGYDRVDRNHYATPRENVAALVVGLRRARITIPRCILDPCGDDGAIARTLNPLGFDVRLTDLHPDEYQSAHEFHATTEPLDTRSAADLRRAVSLTGAQFVLTNAPYSVSTHGAIVKACLWAIEKDENELLALMHLSSHLTTNGGHAATVLEPRFALRVDCCWRTVLFGGPGATKGKQTHTWRVWTREPRRKAFSPYPTIGIRLNEAKAEIAADVAGAITATPPQQENFESCLST